MKYISKLPTEQVDLIKWKEQDKMYKRKNAKWKRFRNPYKEDFTKALIREQGGICCYCEQKLQYNDCHLEHLIPQKLDTFSEHLFDYNNLLCSCQLELSEGEPRHCGNSKGSWYDKTLLVSPLDKDCETKFKYNEYGAIEETDNASRETIKHLQLDIDKLNDLRNKAIEPFIIDPETLEAISEKDAKKFAADYLQLNNGQYNEFYTTIKYLFS